MPSVSRKAKSRRAPVRRKKAKSLPAHTTTAIVKAEAAPQTQIVRQGRVQNLRPEEIALLKRTVAKNTTDDEFSLFMLICKKHKLDPFIKQIHCVKWPVKKHHKELRPTSDGKGQIEVWMPGEEMVIMMGINGYRSIAARSHRDFGGCDEPKFTWFDPPKKTPAGKLIPESCSIKLWKKGLDHPVVSTVYWEEFAPADLGSDRADFWNRIPKHKLALCAESHALRKGYPDLANIYVEEEMDHRLQDYTESGRLMVEADGRAPSGMPVNPEVQTWRDQREVIDQEIERQKRGETPSSVEEMQRRVSEAKPIPPESGPASTNTSQEVRPPAGSRRGVAGASPSPGGRIEIDWQDIKEPILRGDLSEIIEDLKKEFVLVWKNDWWHALSGDVHNIKTFVEKRGYRFDETFPKTQKGTENLPPPKKPAPLAPPLSEQKIVSGTIERVNSGMAGKNPVKHLTLLLADKTKPTYSCFDKKLFEDLDAGNGKAATLVVKQNKQYWNIVGLRKVGSKEWGEDGVPIIQRSQQEAGGRTLF
jgi:phage recombination protein Bet